LFGYEFNLKIHDWNNPLAFSIPLAISNGDFEVSKFIVFSRWFNSS